MIFLGGPERGPRLSRQKLHSTQSMKRTAISSAAPRTTPVPVKCRPWSRLPLAARAAEERASTAADVEAGVIFIPADIAGAKDWLREP